MKTIDKAVALLDRLAEGGVPQGVTDLARAVGLNKAVVHGLLRSLVENGLAEQVPDGRKYRLGPKMLRYGHIRQVDMPVIDCARDLVRSLRDQSDESAQLSLFLGHGTQIAVAFECDHPTRVGFRVGRQLPLHCTASGIAVLSVLPEARAEALLSVPPQPVPDRPDMVTDPVRVRAMVEDARRTGFAVAERTYAIDTTSVGAPVFDAGGAPIAAIVVAGPAHRMTPDKVRHAAELVTGAARTLSRAMGYDTTADAA